ncbi:hypothetical protein [Jannaschia seohaensis]|uniref:Uncharacterized protein n=1 Tax=Jannaschia seohaensis TaxID=475081 RepID=A0A2Y9AUH9_9RHOB|nr:hypothetical protein [Jannaschia seohaensis]PWJ17555.1 hypothetical protein BCF38_106166 [Jannaschia seohaensis]SSA47706.1 hypothetical protein SAMN05421539_106166 [Jannaschia seohaensis]
MNLETGIARADLDTRVEPFLLRRMAPDPDPVPVRRLVPKLTWNRLDLAIKRAFLESLGDRPSEAAGRRYDAHIKAFSLGEMQEPDSAAKSGAEAFRASFVETLTALDTEGFDPQRSLVPLATDGTILNGAHRTAAAMHLGREIVAIETGLEPFVYDYRYFRGRGMSDADLDAAVTDYVRLSPDAAVALLWPAAEGRDAEVARVLGPLVYRKELSLTPRGAHNLLSQVYRGEPWLGPAEEDHPGIDRKLLPCFSGGGGLRVLVLDLPPDRDRVALKDEIRALFGLGKHSIHITDDHAEALDLARLLLNAHGVHMLDHASPNRFPEVRQLAEELRGVLDASGVPADAVAIDSGMVMGLYGLRAPSDLDYVAAAPGPQTDRIEWHKGDRHGIPVTELLTDPQYHFFYWGLRFISLSQVTAMKARRLAGQDAEDLERIRQLPSVALRSPWQDFVYRARFLQSRTKRQVIRGLARIGLKEPARRIYRRVRGGWRR